MKVILPDRLATDRPTDDAKNCPIHSKMMNGLTFPFPSFWETRSGSGGPGRRGEVRPESPRSVVPITITGQGPQHGQSHISNILSSNRVFQKNVSLNKRSDRY